MLSGESNMTTSGLVDLFASTAGMGLPPVVLPSNGSGDSCGVAICGLIDFGLSRNLRWSFKSLSSTAFAAPFEKVRTLICNEKMTCNPTYKLALQTGQSLLYVSHSSWYVLLDNCRSTEKAPVLEI